MPHRRYDSALHDRLYARTPLRHFWRTAVRTVVAVGVTTLVWLVAVTPKMEYSVGTLTHTERVIRYPIRGERWGFAWNDSMLLNTLEFIFVRLTSPLILGTVVAAGSLALFLEYRRRFS